MATRSGSPPYQFLICEEGMEAWVALSALCGDTDHILKQVFGKPGFPCVEEKKAFFQISKESRPLVGLSHLGEGLNHYDHADIMVMMMLMMMRMMMMIVQGCCLKLLHFHPDFVIRRRNTEGDSWMKPTHLSKCSNKHIRGCPSPPDLASLHQW